MKLLWFIVLAFSSWITSIAMDKKTVSSIFVMMIINSNQNLKDPYTKSLLILNLSFYLD